MQAAPPTNSFYRGACALPTIRKLRSGALFSASRPDLPAPLETIIDRDGLSFRTSLAPEPSVRSRGVPYYLQPDKHARKSYVLLAEVMRRTGKYGMAKILLRSRQYIAAVYPEGDVLVVNLLRYAHELRDQAMLDLPRRGMKGMDLSEGEIKMAERLVESMAGEWDPKKYHDTYREDLLQMIHRRIETGQTAETTEPAPRPSRPAKVVNIMELLKRSLEQAEKSGAGNRRKHETRRKAG